MPDPDFTTPQEPNNQQPVDPINQPENPTQSQNTVQEPLIPQQQKPDPSQPPQQPVNREPFNTVGPEFNIWKVFSIFSIVLLVALISGGSYYAYKILTKVPNETSIDDNLKVKENGFFEIPQEISKEDALKPDKDQASKIFEAIRTDIDSEESDNKRGVVINLLKDGELVTPNLEDMRSSSVDISQGETENKNTYILADPPDETFESWSESEKEILTEVINRGYDLNYEILGPPAFNDTVKIYKQNGRGYYTPWGVDGGKSIVIPNTDSGTMVHEMAHSFHSDLIFTNRAWEEGMAMLVENQYLMRYEGDSVGYDLSEEYYQERNKPIISTPNFYSNSFGSDAIEVVSEHDHYFMAGNAMTKVYIEDTGYLKAFNQEYYSKYFDSEFGYVSEDDIRSTFFEIVKNIEGMEASSWLYSNYILINKYDSSQRLIYLDGNIFFLERLNDYATNTLKQAQISLVVESLDGVEVLNKNYTTNGDGVAFTELFGSVPSSDLYKLSIVAESKEGLVSHQEYIDYISQGKTPDAPHVLPDRNNYIYGPAASKEEISAKSKDGTVLSSIIKNNMFIIDGIKDLSQYTFSQGSKKITMNVVETPGLLLDFFADSEGALIMSEDVVIRWTNPSDPYFVVGGDKSPSLVFSNDSVEYSKPYINLCAEIVGDYNKESVHINGEDVVLKKGQFCKYFDLNNGVNNFEITVATLNEGIISSKRVINKVGNEAGSYNDLIDLVGVLDYAQGSEQEKSRLDVEIFFYGNETVKSLENVIYGVTINGGYYKPDLDSYDDSPLAAFFIIKNLAENPSTDGWTPPEASYKSTIALETGVFPFRVGSNKICLLIDPLGYVQESNEDNNDYCMTIDIE